MINQSCDTFWIKIYLSGPLEVIQQVCREECLREGLCVTVDPTRFIYTGGEETGAVVGLLNFPRFPATEVKLQERGIKLAQLLLDRTFQHSVLFMTPTKTTWLSKRTS